MHIPTGSASYGVPQDGQDENFMTALDDCSLSACVAFAPAANSSPYFVCAGAVFCMRC